MLLQYWLTTLSAQLEIKCPYAHRHSTVLDAAASEFFLGDYDIKLYLTTNSGTVWTVHFLQIVQISLQDVNVYMK